MFKHWGGGGRLRSMIYVGVITQLVKNNLSDYMIHNYANSSIAFGDSCDQVNRIDQKIIDKYLIKEQSFDNIKTI